MDSGGTVSEKELYDRLNQYREQRRTSALTTFDIKHFATENELNVGPKAILKFIALGNACAWGTYDIACKHYGAYKESIDSLIQGISL